MPTGAELTLCVGRVLLDPCDRASIQDGYRELQSLSFFLAGEQRLFAKKGKDVKMRAGLGAKGYFNIVLCTWRRDLARL